MFNGHCILKHQKNSEASADYRNVFRVELDNGTDYSFHGQNKNSLHVNSHGGYYGVQLREEGNDEIFFWREGNAEYRLAARVDTQHSPTASTEDDKSGAVIGTLAGAALGAILGSVFGGKDRDSNQSQASNNSSFSEEISCRTSDTSISVLKNSRGELIFQARADLMPNDPVIVGNGRIVRRDKFIERIFEQPGFRHRVQTVEEGRRTVNYYITERGGEVLNRQECI